MPENSNLTRRTVVKGAAWTAPVVAAAIAVPAVSASCLSGTADVTANSTPYCKVPNTGLRFSYIASATANTCSTTVTFTKAEMFLSTGTSHGSTTSFTPAGGSSQISPTVTLTPTASQPASSTVQSAAIADPGGNTQIYVVLTGTKKTATGSTSFEVRIPSTGTFAANAPKSC